MKALIVEAGFIGALCMCPAPRSAPLPLSGEQDGLYESRAYVVTGDVEVKQGRHMRLLAGTVLRFMPDTRFVVRGELVCTGDKALPIVFTSASDTAAPATPHPFDWAGIVVQGHASVRMAHVIISYSTFGVRVDSSSAVELREAIFKRNGRADFQIGGLPIAVQEQRPFSFPPAQESASDTVSKPQPAPDVEDVESRSGRRRARLKAGAGVACGLLAAAGAGVAIYAHASAGRYEEKYESGRGPNVAEYERLYRQSIAGRNVSIGAAAAGAIGLSVVIILR